MIRVALFALLLALCVSCGHRGPVRPLGKPVPTAPAAFTIRQQGDSLLLHWQPPTRRGDGRSLRDLARYRLERAVFTPDNDCAECDRGLTPVAVFAAVGSALVQQVDGQVYYRDQPIRSDRIYRYWLTPVTTGGITGPPARAVAHTWPAPDAPADLTGQARDRHVVLSWPAVSTAQGYNVYRGESKAALAPEPINIKPLSKTGYTDFKVKNNHPYRYAVRAIRSVDGQSVESPLSPLRTLTPISGARTQGQP